MIKDIAIADAVRTFLADESISLHSEVGQIVVDYLASLAITAQDICEVIGVDAGSFQQWLARKIVPFVSVKHGNRTLRRFSASDIPRLTLISTIWRNGIPISSAGKLANGILSGLRESKNAGHEEPEYMLCFLCPGQLITDDGSNPPKSVVRGANSIDSIPVIFDEVGSASCLIISTYEWNRDIDNAVRLILKAASTRRPPSLSLEEAQADL